MKESSTQNPMETLLAQWRAPEAPEGAKACAEQLEAALKASVVPLPDGLLHRLLFAIQGGYVSPQEVQHLMATCSVIASLNASLDFRVQGELMALDRGIVQASGGAIKVILFARELTRQADQHNKQVALAAPVNGRKLS